MDTLVYGLVTGIFFGFFLQKGRVVRYDKQVGALLLKDMTILKFMLTTIIVGMVGIHLLHDMGLVRFRVIPLTFGPNLIGGLLFGVGWGFVGYCPGTVGGALGEGRWDALWAILGMLAGAALYAEAFPLLRDNVLTWGRFEVRTLPQLLGLSHWVVIPVFVVGIIYLFKWFEKKNL